MTNDDRKSLVIGHSSLVIVRHVMAAFAQILTDNQWIVQLSVFGLIAALAWLAVDWLGAGRSRAEQRLEDFKDPMSRKRREEGGPGKKKNDAMARMLEASA